MSDLEAFRKDVRAWLEANCPASMRTPMPLDEIPLGGRRKANHKNPDTTVWLQRMGAKGWTAPNWPKEYGGGGLSKEEAKILREEMDAFGCRPAHIGFGMTMIGPTLLELGSEEQKKEHLPKIVRGEICWCQGYSEPGAGSDLASLQTKAVDDGDAFIVTGQKIWTSGADKADWMFCLVRTDPKEKHKGITFILFDMASEGVSVKPIKLISGLSPFCETFLDGVRVPKKNVVGKINEGWTIAKRLLQHERESIASIGSATNRLRAPLHEHAKEYIGLDNGKLADPKLRDEITRFRMNQRAFELTKERSAQEQKAGEGPSATSSIFKYYGTEQNKRKYEIMLAYMGQAALGWEGESFSDDELNVTREWLRSKGNSIEGGTSEIQLNVVAKRVLGLPSE
jgi:alkylation response protein AidB-like acyl-CoA dehydrogenase